MSSFCSGSIHQYPLGLLRLGRRTLAWRLGPCYNPPEVIGMAKALREIEGMWEEITARGAELAGRRVRVTVLEDKPKLTDDEWVRLLKSVGIPAGVSLSDEAVSRENMYE